MHPSKENIVRAAIGLLRRSGLTGAGVNNVIEESGAPKGSLYHHFPKGKADMVEAALQAFGEKTRDNLARALTGQAPSADKLLSLFQGIGARLAASDYSQGCAVGAVVLNLGKEDAPFAATCAAIFRDWEEAIGAALADQAPGPERDAFAQFVIIALEGALILSRARQDLRPLANAAAMLGRLTPAPDRSGA